MERIRLQNIAKNVLDDKPLVDAFHEVANQENIPPDTRRPHLKRNPVWLEATKWKPGQSGNPKGRPRVVKISTAVINKLKEVEPETGLTYAELIASALVKKAINGDVAAARELREVTEGAIAQKLEIGGSLSMNFHIENATDEELDQIIQHYLEVSYGNAANKDKNTAFSPGESDEQNP